MFFVHCLSEIVHCLSESNCARMYSVHGRVMVDNMYEFQHVPDVPNKFRLSSCKQESRPSIPRGLGTNIGRLVT